VATDGPNKKSGVFGPVCSARVHSFDWWCSPHGGCRFGNGLALLLAPASLRAVYLGPPSASALAEIAQWALLSVNDIGNNA
jgi:hypothetical protein